MDRKLDQPVDFKQVCAELAALLPRLTAILRDENRALAEHRYRSLEASATDKAQLAARYDRLIAMLASAPPTGIDAATRVRLRQLGAGLAEAANENERRLNVASEAHRRLMGAIAEAVRTARPNVGGYGRSGALPAGRRGSALPPAAISLDRAC